jgi:hypothetical protein
VPDYHYGDIVAKAAGSVTISASDSTGAHGFYPVTVSGGMRDGEDFENVRLGTINAPLDIGTMIISGKLDTGLVLIDMESESPPCVTGRGLMCRLAAEYDMLLTFPEEFSQVRLGLLADESPAGPSAGVPIDALDADNNVLARFFSDPFIPSWFDFRASNGKKIKKIHVHPFNSAIYDRGFVKLDNFTFTR